MENSKLLVAKLRYECYNVPKKGIALNELLNSGSGCRANKTILVFAAK